MRDLRHQVSSEMQRQRDVQHTRQMGTVPPLRAQTGESACSDSSLYLYICVPARKPLDTGVSSCSRLGKTTWPSARDGVNIVGAECIRDTGAPPRGHAADKLPRIGVDEALGAFTARRIQARLGVVAVRSSQLHEQLLFARSTRARARIDHKVGCHRRNTLLGSAHQYHTAHNLACTPSLSEAADTRRTY